MIQSKDILSWTRRRSWSAASRRGRRRLGFRLAAVSRWWRRRGRWPRLGPGRGPRLGGGCGEEGPGCEGDNLGCTATASPAARLPSHAVRQIPPGRPYSFWPRICYCPNPGDRTGPARSHPGATKPPTRFPSHTGKDPREALADGGLAPQGRSFSTFSSSAFISSRRGATRPPGRSRATPHPVTWPQKAGGGGR